MVYETKSQPAGAQPGLGCLLRLFWMAFGNVALLFAGAGVAMSDHIGAPDLIYACVVVALLAARYVDVVKLNGMTIHASPATRVHLRRLRRSALRFRALRLVGRSARRFLGILITKSRDTKEPSEK